jgi:hypothetical protein
MPDQRPRRAMRWMFSRRNERRLNSISLLVTSIGGVVALLITVIALFVPDDDDPPAADLGYVASLPGAQPTCERASSWVVPGPVSPGTRFDPRQPPPRGVLATGSRIDVTVQGPPGRTLVLRSLTGNVLKRTAPTTGAHLKPGGCGGQIIPRFLTLDLDARQPVAVPSPSPGDSSTVDDQLRITVAEEDPQSLLIDLMVADSAVEFVLELSWSVGSEQRMTTIDDDGRPFTVSSLANATPMCITDGVAEPASGPEC